MLGVSALMLGLGYFVQAVSLLTTLANALMARQRNDVLWWTWVVSLDFVLAAALDITGIGMLFLQRWAKTMWLWTISTLVVLHLSMVFLYQAGPGVTDFYLLWTSLVTFLAVMSWWLFTASSPNPNSTEATPADSESV